MLLMNNYRKIKIDNYLRAIKFYGHENLKIFIYLLNIKQYLRIKIK